MVKATDMEIEFKNLDGRFEVIEHVLRKATLPYAEGDAEPIMHLQARLMIQEFKDDCIDCSISYYDENHGFLGLDSCDSIFLTKSKDNSVPISVALDIPEGAHKAVVRFIFNDDAKAIEGFYRYALKGLTILGLFWLATLILKNLN